MSLTQKLKLFKNIQPREKWLKETRAFFLLQAKKEFIFEKHKKESLLDNQYTIGLRLFLRPMSIFAMIAILFFSGSTFAINAAKNTTPGDPLYVIKINLEKTQKMLTNNKEKKVGLAINFSNERLKEFKKLSNSVPSIENNKNIKIATQNLNEGIKEIKVSLNNLKEELNPKTTVETAKTVNTQTFKIEKELIQTKKEASPIIKEEIENVLTSVEETSSHALQTIIGEQEMTKKDIVLKNEATNIIENKIKQTEEKIEEVKNKATDLAKVLQPEILILIKDGQGGGQIDQIDDQKIKENTEIIKQRNQSQSLNNKKENETTEQGNQLTSNDNSSAIEVNSAQNPNDKKENKIQEQEKNKTQKPEDAKIQDLKLKSEEIIDSQKIKDDKDKKNDIKEMNNKAIDSQIKENKEKSKEIIKETTKAEEILKEVKESLKQKGLNKVDLNIIADKVAVSKKLTNIADKVAEKAIEKK